VVLKGLSGFMGRVIVTFRIMPESVEVDLDSLEQKIKSEISPQRIQRVPIAFGLNAIQIIKLVEITDKIKKIKGVRKVEVVGLTRSL